MSVEKTLCNDSRVSALWESHALLQHVFMYSVWFTHTPGQLSCAPVISLVLLFEYGVTRHLYKRYFVVSRI